MPAKADVIVVGGGLAGLCCVEASSRRDPFYCTPDQFAAFIRAETDKWTRVVKFSNAKVD